MQSLLLLRREQLQPTAVAQPIAEAAARIEATLAPEQPWSGRPTPAAPGGTEPALPALPAMAEALPDPFVSDVTPWLLRRLRLATGLAGEVREDAERVLAGLDAPPPA